MNEITRIHLGRQPFTIAVDAHKALQEYLQAIKKAVGKSHKEVAKEVELRMAELLIERGITADKVVIAEDVAYLKEQLGKPGDFSEGDEAADEPAQGDAPAEDGERVPKRLFRDTQHAAIAGVLSGLAAYFGVSAVLVRLLYVVFTFLTSGVGVLIYFILWLAIPPARTQSERLQMQGKPVTVDSLKEVVSQADFEGAANRASRTLEPLAMTTLKILSATVGVILVVTAICIWIGAIAAGSFLLVTGVQVDGVPLFPVGIREAMLVGCGVAAMIIVAIALHLFGMAAIRRKWSVKGWVGGLLAGLFILFCSLGTALAFNVASDIDKRVDDVRHEKVLLQPEFTQLHIQGDGDYITYAQSDRYAVELQYVGDKARDLSQLATVKDSTLTIDMTKADKPKNCDFWCIPPQDIQVKVYAPSLQDIRITGDAYVSVDQAINQDQLAVTVDASGHLSLHGVQIDKVTIDDQREHGYLQLVAQGIRDNRAPYPQSPAVSMDGEWIDLGDVGNVELTTSSVGCTENEQFVRAEQPPRSLVINGQQVEPVQLARMAAGQYRSPLHCFTLY